MLAVKPEPAPRKSRVVWIALVATSLVLSACGPGNVDRGASDDDAPRNFGFVRWAGGIARIDTRTGAVSTVLANGDGGWSARGAAPDLLGQPAEPGRFGMRPLPRNPSRIRAAGAEDGVLLRTDLSDGRAWILLDVEDTQWLEIRDPDRATAAPTAQSSAQPTPPTTPPTGAPSSGAGPDAEGYRVLGRAELDPSPEVQQKLVETLREARAKPDLPYEMRIWSVQQLAGVDPDLAVPELLEILAEDEDPVMMAEAIRALGKIARPSTIPRIVALAQHPDERVRAAADEVITEVE